MIGPLLRTRQQHPQYDSMVRKIINSDPIAEKTQNQKLRDVISNLFTKKT